MPFNSNIRTAINRYHERKGPIRRLIGDHPFVQALERIPEEQKNDDYKLVMTCLQNPIRTIFNLGNTPRASDTVLDAVLTSALGDEARVKFQILSIIYRHNRENVTTKFFNLIKNSKSPATILSIVINLDNRDNFSVFWDADHLYNALCNRNAECQELLQLLAKADHLAVKLWELRLAVIDSNYFDNRHMYTCMANTFENNTKIEEYHEKLTALKRDQPGLFHRYVIEHYIGGQFLNFISLLDQNHQQTQAKKTQSAKTPQGVTPAGDPHYGSLHQNPKSNTDNTGTSKTPEQPSSTTEGAQRMPASRNG